MSEVIIYKRGRYNLYNDGLKSLCKVKGMPPLVEYEASFSQQHP